MAASCIVKVEVEIPCTGAYGNDWKIPDILRQARQEAVNSVQSALSKITRYEVKATGHRVILTDETP